MRCAASRRRTRWPRPASSTRRRGISCAERRAALIEYTVTEADLKGPFAEDIPAKYEDKAKLKRLDYTGATEMLAERFHMDENFLEALNRGKDFDKAGRRSSSRTST